MVHQLIKAHPQVGWIENEEGYIEYDKPKEWLLMMAKKSVPDLKRYSWGEKLPWGTREEDKDGKRIIKDSRRWLKIFGNQARVLQVLRHPIDVSLSSYPLDIQRTTVAEDQLKFSLNSIPKVINFINKDSRCGVIIFEELVMNPRQKLADLFQFLNLASSEKIIEKVMKTNLKFGKINPHRAFVYRRLNIDIEVDYDILTRRIKNKI